MKQSNGNIIGEDRVMPKDMNQLINVKGRIVEADEFSFVAEHIEDEPSIHVRSITQF